MAKQTRPVSERQAAAASALSRREVLGLGAIALTAGAGAMGRADDPLLTISLAQWSLHRALQGGTLDHLDFPKAARNDYAIDAVEYVNTFFKEKAKPTYVDELANRCRDLGVTSLLIMCDAEGDLGDPDQAK